MQFSAKVQGEGARRRVQVQVLGQVSNSINLQVDSASPSRAAPTLAPSQQPLADSNMDCPDCLI